MPSSAFTKPPVPPMPKADAMFKIPVPTTWKNGVVAAVVVVQEPTLMVAVVPLRTSVAAAFERDWVSKPPLGP